MELRKIADSLGIAEYPSELEAAWAALPESDIDICNKEVILSLQNTMNILGDNLQALLDEADKLRQEPARYAWGQTVALWFREADLEACKAVPMPVAEGDGDPLLLLVLLSHLPRTVDEYLRRGLTEAEIRETLSTFRWCAEVIRRITGVMGVDLRYFRWLCLYIKCTMLRHSGFEFELRSFSGPCKILRSEVTGELVPVMDGITLHREGMVLGSAGFEDPEGAREAVLTETADAYIGIPAIQGRAAGTIREFPKAEWSVAVAPGDKVLSIHLPKGVDMSKEHLDEALCGALARASRYFPEISVKAIYCGSWLLDPTLENILGPDSRIIRFGARFARYPHLSAGREVFSFVFPPKSTDLTKLPENTTLERGLKKLYLSGDYVHAYCGVFLHDV